MVKPKGGAAGPLAASDVSRLAAVGQIALIQQFELELPDRPRAQLARVR